MKLPEALVPSIFMIKLEINKRILTKKQSMIIMKIVMKIVMKKRQIGPIRIIRIGVLIGTRTKRLMFIIVLIKTRSILSTA